MNQITQDRRQTRHRRSRTKYDNLHRRQISSPRSKGVTFQQHHADLRTTPSATLPARTRPMSSWRWMPPMRPRKAWGRVPAAERANILLKIADRDRGQSGSARQGGDLGQRQSRSAKPPPQTFPYPSIISVISPVFCAVRKARCRRSTPTRLPTTSMSRLVWLRRSFPGTFSILMAAWKLAPALAAGNCVILKPAEQTPAAIMVLAELIGDLSCPPGF